MAVGMVGSATLLGGGVANAEGETALILPGASEPVGPMRALYHFDPAWRPQIGANYYDSANADKQIIGYPGSMWPITGLDAPTVGESVVVGTDNLDAAIRSTPGPKVVTSLSMGTLALDAEQRRLATDPTAPPPDELTFIKVSTPSTVLQRAFKPGTHVPVIDYTVQAPFESQYDTIEIVSEYDLYADPPDRKNPLAYINGIMGQSHSNVAFSNPADLPPPIVTTNSRGATTTTYFIPAEELPLTSQFREWGVPTPVADRLETVMRPMVDNAYARNDDPGQPPAPQRPAVPLNLQNLNLPKVNVPSLNVPAIGPGPAAGAPANPVNLLNAGRIVSKLIPGGKR
jgi:hypothetical protein